MCRKKLSDMSWQLRSLGMTRKTTTIAAGPKGVEEAVEGDEGAAWEARFVVEGVKGEAEAKGNANQAARQVPETGGGEGRGEWKTKWKTGRSRFSFVDLRVRMVHPSLQSEGPA